MYCKTKDGLKIYYEVTGNRGSPETIVFLNGLTQSTLSWGLTTPFFTDCYRIILMDFVFQGQSDKTGNWRTFDEHAGDVASVVHNEHLAKVHLVGLSYGSLVAQHFAVLFPELVSKLVLISTFAYKTPYYEAIELSWWRALESGGYKLLLDIMLPTVLSEAYFSEPLVPIDVMKQMRQDVNGSNEAIFKLMTATRERRDFRNELKKITAPSLIVQGEYDTLFPPHHAVEVGKNIPKSKLAIVQKAGHTLNLERVPEVCRLINEFLGS